MKNLLIVFFVALALFLVGCISEQAESPEEPTPEASSIADVVQQIKENPEATFTATIEGVVTYEWTKYLFVQDETGGMKVYYGDGGIDEDVDIGDKVRVSGTAKYWASTKDYEIEIDSLDAVEIIQEDYGEPEPRTLGSTPTEDDYGLLVTFSGTCTEIDYEHDNVTFISDGGFEVTVKNYVGYSFNVGTYYTITGVVMWNYDRYKVVPRTEDDITIEED